MNARAVLILCGMACSWALAAVAADPVPTTPEALWASVDKESGRTPLEAEVLKTWEQDSVMMHMVRFTVGVYRGKKSKLAGYYGYPKGGSNLPALVQINGGGQRGSPGGPLRWAKRGYACFNPNNGAQPWEKGIPNTDWGALTPGIPGDRRNGKGKLAPGPGTIDEVVSPRNHQWFPRMVGARRAITFLQGRPEVDPDRIGVRGHSTGGVMTVYVSVDPRVKAAVPSVGGSGFWQAPIPYVTGNLRGTGGADEAQQRLFISAISCDAHWKIMKCPIFFLGASNDFNSPTDNVWKALCTVPHKERSWVLAPHYNHSFNESAAIADLMWFEAHLKDAFEFPAMPKGELILKAADGIPTFTVIPDPESRHRIKAVDVYYSYGRHPVGRFWSDGRAGKAGDRWEGKCPTFHRDEPLFAFACVTYGIDHVVDGTRKTTVPELMVTSSFHAATPGQLAQAGVLPTEKRSRLIETFGGELRDWTGKLDLTGKSRWSISTRKVKDPRWLGPEDGELVFEIKAPAGSLLGASVGRRNRSANAGKANFYAFVELSEDGWNTVRLGPNAFQNIVGEKLGDWHMITGFTLSDGVSMVANKKKFLPRAGEKAVPALPTTVSQWKSSYYQSTDDAYAREQIGGGALTAVGLLRNMRWEGGTYPERPKPREVTERAR
jgi:dienelactone hydrolase